MNCHRKIILALFMNFVWHLGLFTFVFKSSDNVTVIYYLYSELWTPDWLLFTWLLWEKKIFCFPVDSLICFILNWNYLVLRSGNLITWTTALSNSVKLSHAVWGHPRWSGHGGEVWQNVVHWRREWQTTSEFLPWEPHEQYENAKW